MRRFLIALALLLGLAQPAFAQALQAIVADTHHVGGGPATTWSAVAQTNITLDGTALIATTTAGAGDNGVKSTPAKTSGLVYVEVTVTTFSGVFYALGLADTTAGFVDAASDIHTVGWHLINGSGNFAGPGAVTGDTVAFEFNFTTKRAWTSVFHGSSWGSWFGASGVGDPEAGTGGVDFSSLTGTDFFLIFTEPNQVGDVATANFGKSAFRGGGNKTASYSAWAP